MVVTGSFATHTTKLYNYYVCPISFDLNDVSYVAVNYMGELKYLGEVIETPLECKYNGNRNFEGLIGVSDEIKVDLNEFSCMLNLGEFSLLKLNPILGNSFERFLKHKGNHAFVRSHRYFESLADFFSNHQKF